MPEQFEDSYASPAIRDRGTDVGRLAMGLFGEYAEVPFGDCGEMIGKTAELLENGTHVIAEASFSFDGLFCSVDLLINHGHRHVEMVGVKSSAKISEFCQHDVAYQYYVLTRSGFTVESVRLAHVNSGYVRHGDLDLQRLFSLEDMTDQTRRRQPERYTFEDERREGNPRFSSKSAAA